MTPRVPPGVARLAIIVSILAAWEILPRAGLVAPLFLPPLSHVLRALVTDWQEFGNALLATLAEVAPAMLLACGGGMLVGIVVGAGPRLHRVLLPLFSSAYAVPIVILYPILAVWLGIGPESKIAFAAIYGFFPTLLTTAAGVRTIDGRLVMTARSLGASTVQRLVRVVLPAAIPAVLAGVRLGGALVIVGVVVAEMLTSTAGIGFLVTRYRTILDSEHVYAAVLMVVVLAYLFDAFMRVVEQRTVMWRTAGRGEAPVTAAAVAS
jgi:NitT/TauT family transport system permease protein